MISYWPTSPHAIKQVWVQAKNPHAVCPRKHLADLCRRDKRSQPPGWPLRCTLQCPDLETEQPWRRLVKVSVISNGSHAEIIMNKWAYFDVVLVWLWTGNNRSSYDDTMKHPTTCSWTSGPSCKVSKNQVLQKGSMPFSPGAKGCPFGWLSWFGEARCELATTTLQMMLFSCSQLLLQENKTYSNIYTCKNVDVNIWLIWFDAVHVFNRSLKRSAIK